MKPKFQVFVPSKKRPKNSPTIFNLVFEEIRPTVVVEKEDLESYREVYTDKVDYLVLPKSNQGIVYVRDFIKRYATDKKLPWYWMIDDDVKQTYETVGGKNVKMPMGQAMAVAESHYEKAPNVFIGGLEYQQFAWSAKSMYAMNGYCEVFVCVNTEKAKFINYRQPGGKEDRDFVLQGLSMGMDAMRIRKLSFAAPKNGSNAGGLSEIFYDVAGKEKAASEEMCRRWPGVCELNIKSDGRPDVKILWKQFKRT